MDAIYHLVTVGVMWTSVESEVARAEEPCRSLKSQRQK